jgi:7-carboxy-7-deazaguanine synthase
MKIQLSEIFTSIQGETSCAGYVSVFVRTAGCNLSCSYCDTGYAHSGGDSADVDDIIKKIRGYGPVHHITVTGGEPLCQNAVPLLVEKLISLRYRVRIETNGSIDISCVPPPAERIVDVKTPSSGESGSFCMNNIKQLAPTDEVKFVVSHKADIEFACKFCLDHLLNISVPINVSPVPGMISFAECAHFILAEMPYARFNVQLHKIIWPNGEPK